MNGIFFDEQFVTMSKKISRFFFLITFVVFAFAAFPFLKAEFELNETSLFEDIEEEDCLLEDDFIINTSFSQLKKRSKTSLGIDFNIIKRYLDVEVPPPRFQHSIF